MVFSGGRKPNEKKIMALLSLGLLLFSPDWIFADRVGLEHSTSWIVEDEEKITFCRGQQPLAVIVFQEGALHQKPRMRFG